MSLIRKHTDAKRVLPLKYAAFDCETEGLYGDARLICLVFSTGEQHSFITDNDGDCIDKFLDFILRPKYRGFRFYAHNVGFDISKTFGKRFGNILDDRNFDVMMVGSRIIQAKYTVDQREKDNKKASKIYLLDTGNLIPATKLSEIGDDLGYEKHKTPKKWLTGKTITNVDSEDIKYCMRDCEIVLKIIDLYGEFLEPFNVKLKLTVGANAKALWKAIELRDKHLFLDETKDEVFRQSYYGGRTEVFVRGYRKQKLYYYDVNSMYPFVMTDNPFPNPDKLRYSKDLNKALRTNEGCAKIKITPPRDIKYPALPERRNDMTLFPAYQLTGVWNFPHIRLALEKGYVIDHVYWVLSSLPIESPFNAYIKLFREKKIKYQKNNQTALRNLSKRMMNALYGKFAQRNEIEDRYTHIKPEEETFFRPLTDNTWMIGNIEKERANETVVCFSSYITCYAQCLLYSFFEDNIHYCDTDSIVLEQPLPPELVSEDEFGLVALEHEIIESNFVSPKRYAFKTSDGETKKVCKGVSKLSLSQMEIKTYHYDVGVFYDKPYKEKTALRKNVPVFSIEKVQKVLSIKPKNEKRIFGKDGNSRPVKLIPDQ